MDGRMNSWVDGWIDSQMDGQMDGSANGWMDRCELMVKGMDGVGVWVVWMIWWMS